MSNKIAEDQASVVLHPAVNVLSKKAHLIAAMDIVNMDTFYKVLSMAQDWHVHCELKLRKEDKIPGGFDD